MQNINSKSGLYLRCFAHLLIHLSACNHHVYVSIPAKYKLMILLQEYKPKKKSSIKIYFLNNKQKYLADKNYSAKVN